MNKDDKFQTILSRLYSQAHSPSPSFLSEETYILAIESAFNSIVITDEKGIVQYANPAVERITGYTRKEVIGKNTDLWGGLMDKQFYKHMWEVINEKKVFLGEVKNKRKNGDVYTARISISPIIKDEKIIGFIGTEEDITLEKKLQKEKEEFISMASHQLRTPLGAMKWNLELITEQFPQAEKELQGLAVQNEYMIDLVNRLLMVLRIGDNRLIVYEESVNINELMDEITSHFQVKLVSSSVSLEVTKPTHDNIVFTDPILIKEIVSNLIDNSIKFSKPGNKIAALVSVGKTEWSITVKDMGIGISREDIPHIYEKFYRGRNVLSIPGTGLGMYITSTYVQRLLGTMKVESNVNEGTTVTCVFPSKVTKTD